MMDLLFESLPFDNKVRFRPQADEPRAQPVKHCITGPLVVPPNSQ
jgi:hypothetical protein